MTSEICTYAFRKSGIFQWNPKNIDFSKLTDLEHSQDVARPTGSVIVLEFAGIGVQNTKIATRLQ